MAQVRNILHLLYYKGNLQPPADIRNLEDQI